MDLGKINELITGRIYLIRGKKVMMDRDLAKLYGVETKYFNRSVRNNMLRFPDDFVFEGKRTVMSWEKELSQYAQIGNAVAPRVSYLLGRGLYEQLLRKPECE